MELAAKSCHKKPIVKKPESFTLGPYILDPSEDIPSKYFYPRIKWDRDKKYKNIPYDRRCICDIVGSSMGNIYGCTGYIPKDKSNENKTFHNTGLILLHRDTEQFLGCICLEHYYHYLAICLRFAAYHYTISMNDIKGIEVSIVKGGSVPYALEWHETYAVNPNWVKGDDLKDRWILRNGHVNKCSRCCEQFIFRYKIKCFSEYNSNYICDGCARQLKANGCEVCKVPLNDDNCYTYFPINNEKGYLCHDCYRCMFCKKKLLDRKECEAKRMYIEDYTDDVRAGRVDNARMCGACSTKLGDSNGYEKLTFGRWQAAIAAMTKN